MPRAPEDDSLEPILPKHPPVARDDVPLTEPAVAVSDEPPAPRPRPSWDRLVFLGCAVVATLALVVSAMRLTSVAENQRIQSCQAKAYMEQQLRSGSRGFDPGDRAFRQSLADCLGVSVDTDD